VRVAVGVGDRFGGAKRCGHLAGKQLVTVEEMADKIAAAAAARRDRNTVIIARTDARGVTGMDECLRRLEAYRTAGADWLFPEALASQEEFQAVGRAFRGRGPLLANMTEFGVGPLLDRADLESAGFAAVLECLYTGKLVAEEEMVPKVVHLSNKLGLPAVRTACVAHLVSRVGEGNMEQMLAMGEELGSSELVDAAKVAIRKCSGRASPAGGDDGRGNKTTKCPWTKEEDEQVVLLVERFVFRRFAGVSRWLGLEPVPRPGGA
jgi:hypothetical protein